MHLQNCHFFMFMLVFRGCTRQPAPLSGWFFRLDWDLLDKLPATYPKKHPITTSLNQSVQGFNFRLNVHPPKRIECSISCNSRKRLHMEAKNWWSFCRWWCVSFSKGRKSTNPNKIGGVLMFPFFEVNCVRNFGGMFSNFRGSRPAALGSFIQNRDNVPRCAQLEDGGGGWVFGAKKDEKMLETWHSHEIWHQIKFRNLQLVMKFADINKCWVGSNRQWIYGMFFEWFARFIVVFGLGVHKALNFLGRCPTGHSWIQQLIPGKISYYNWGWFVSFTGGAILLMVQKSGEKTTWDV